MNIKFRIIKLFLLINFLVFLGLLTSCEKEVVFPKCKVNSDCEVEYACYKKECLPDICVGKLRSYGEDFCGKGVCITGSNMGELSVGYNDTNYECKCDENAVLYEGKCVPTCNGFSQECRDFDKELYNCNISLGHCAFKCEGEGSCEEGHYCSSGGICSVIEGYCNSNNDCVGNVDNKTVCNTTLNLCEELVCIEDTDCEEAKYCDNNQCLDIEDFCNSDNDCIDNVNNKTICNTELNLCEWPATDHTKAEFITEYTDVFCQKMFECDGDYNSFDTLEDCKIDMASKMTPSLDSVMCDIFDGFASSDMINCASSYTCSTEETVRNLEGCANEYFMDMCKDTENKNEASVQISIVFCDNLFFCDEEFALQRYDDVEDCKTRSKNEIYYEFMYENICINYKANLLADYITCRELLTCQQDVNDCITQYNTMCD
jgi:hypothetical protein